MSLTITASKNWLGHALRYGTDEEGTVWFVLNDVMTALGITNPSMASRLRKKFPEALSVCEVLDSNGKTRKTNTIKEDIIYSYVVPKSSKPEALAFCRWVGKVIKSVRQTGQYRLESLEMRRLDMQLLKMTLEHFPDDARMQFFAKEKMASLLGNDQLTLPTRHKPLTVSEIMERNHTRREILKNRIGVGRHVAKRYRELFGNPKTTEKFVNGHSCQVKVYPYEKFNTIDGWVSDYLSNSD